MSDNKPTVSDLNVCLRDVIINWTSFALLLPGINQTELDIIEANKPGDVEAKKLELYKKWLRVHPNASWNDVVKALEMVGENAIAKQLREKYQVHQSFGSDKTVSASISPAPSSHAVSSTPQSQTAATTEGTSTTDGGVTVCEEIVTELDTLNQTFLGLEDTVESEVESKLEIGDLTVKSVTHHLKRERAFTIPSLNSVTTSDELFDAIRPHCKAIAEKATEYKEKVKKFMKTTKIRSFQNSLKCCYSKIFRERSTNTTVVEIVVENAWEEQELWMVENLVTTLFPVKHPDELPWYDIVPGSVVMTFIALEHMTPSLIESSRKKTEFMRLIGVISLKIGDELVWKKPLENEKPFSFEDSLTQGTLADNIEAIQFLLQYTQVNVDTKNTSIMTPVYAYWNQEIVEIFLRDDHALFTILLKDVEYEFQFVQGQMTVDNNSNTRFPVGDDDSGKSTHCPRDNFLNGKALAGLSDQLPEHLSIRVKQYQATIDGIIKRKSLLIYLQSSLEKYFPTPFPDSIAVILTLHNMWRACSVWYVEQLGQLILTPTLFHKLQWFRVNTSESLRVVWLADKENVDSLTKECLGNDESLTPLLGVISVQVDDTVVINNDYSIGYTFNEAIELAKAMGNAEVSDLLLQTQQPPVNFIRFQPADSNNNRQFVPDPDSTPLMIACSNNNSQLVQLLLDYNADPNIQSRNRYTALMYSTANSKTFQMLSDHGADIDKATFFNETVLYFACWTGNVKIVKTIIAKNRDLVHRVSNDGWTALKIASQNGHIAVVEFLLQAKADPNIQDNNGCTALYIASQKGHTAVVELLLQAKADPNIQDNNGSTALEIASQEGHTAIVELLFQAKADPNIQDNDGWTALYIASQNSHTAVVELLLQTKADPNIQDNNGSTALEIASQEGHTAIVELLLQAKADPNIQDNDGWTALYIASQNSHTAVVELLLQAKADPNIQDNNGSTVLKMASQAGHTAMVKLLLKAGADVSRDGTRLLELALENNHSEIAEKLCQAMFM